MHYSTEQLRQLAEQYHSPYEWEFRVVDDFDDSGVVVIEEA